MGQQSLKEDVESAGERLSRRGCLDAFFTLSIIFLFVALTVVTVFGVTVVMEKSSSPTSESRSEDTMPRKYKTENFAYLRSISSHLNLNSTMQFQSIPDGEGTSVGSNFDFDPDQHSLGVKQEGSYLVYADLKVTCTYVCSPGLLSVRVGDKLTCDVKLPSNVRFMTWKCSTVTRLQKGRFLTQITVPEGGLPNWKLDVSGSGLGLFFLD